jgi:hypothetical protein
MSKLGEGHEFSLAHLSFGLLHESALSRGEYVIGINHAPGLYEHAIVPLSKCHKIPLLDVEGLEHLTRNDHLAPMAYAVDPLSRCRCSYSHYPFRLSDCVNMSSVWEGTRARRSRRDDGDTGFGSEVGFALEAGTDLISVGWDWILASFVKFSISAGERVRHLAAEGQWISGIWVRA